VVCANCHRVRTHDKNHYIHKRAIWDSWLWQSVLSG
jgi:hypothetical protein